MENKHEPSILEVWRDLGGGPLKEHQHAKFGKTYTGSAFWRQGDNEEAISLVPDGGLVKNSFRDFSQGDGRMHGRWELIAAAKGISVKEAGAWFREKYGTEQNRSVAIVPKTELREARKWLGGMLEYAGQRLETLKQAVQRDGDVPAETQRLIHLWTLYEARLKSIQAQKQGDGYSRSGMQNLVSAYRQHREKMPQWAQATVQRGGQIFEENKQITRMALQVSEKRSVPKTEQIHQAGYSQSAFGVR